MDTGMKRELLGNGWVGYTLNTPPKALKALTPRHKVQYVWFDPGSTNAGVTIAPMNYIDDVVWANVTMYRVIAPEPREYWIVRAGLFSDEDTARDVARDRGCEVIHVREVVK